jgi:hypothetical protein
MELVALTPDVILSIGTNAAVALQQRLALCRYVREHRDFLHLT